MNKDNTLAIKQETLSSRFIEHVQKEFVSAIGNQTEFTEHERKLATNFYIYADNQLKEFEAKRIKDNKSGSPYEWSNVNMAKLAVDVVHRIRLGLDALIKNHLHIVPYWNKKRSQYNLDIRIGYVGKLFIAKQMSIEPIRDIRLYMVHENDRFVFEQINGLEPRETFSFDIKDPFNRGAIKGGFGFIRYEDESLNKVVLVSEEEFKKAQNVAKSSNFWRDWGDRMRFKTLAHRVSDAVRIDPRKVHDSFYQVQEEDSLFTNNIDSKHTEQSIDLEIPDANTVSIEETKPALAEPIQKELVIEMDGFESMAVGTAFE